MNIKKTAKLFKELGNPVRLKIIQRLIKAGRIGVPVGDLQKECNIPNSTLSHHISSLMEQGLIVQQKEGRFLFCVINYSKIEYLKIFLEKDCCIDEQDKKA